jgi:hypothetical protein
MRGLLLPAVVAAALAAVVAWAAIAILWPDEPLIVGDWEIMAAAPVLRGQPAVA